MMNVTDKITDDIMFLPLYAGTKMSHGNIRE